MASGARAVPPRWLLCVSIPYSAFTLAVVLAPELLIAVLWLGGIRPERTTTGYLWPNGWPWWIILSFSFSLIFGSAAIVGLACAPR